MTTTPKKTTKPNKAGRLSPEAAARIRARANRVLGENPTPQNPALRLANIALAAAGDYDRRHRKGSEFSAAENRATAGIFWQYEQFVKLINSGASAEEFARAVGVYICRLERLLAKQEELIESQEFEIETYFTALMEEQNAGTKSG